jgi:putative FmdB family regulatory protein
VFAIGVLNALDADIQNMPKYDFQCGQCGVVNEIEKSLGEDTTPICCNQNMTRLWSATPAIFKGSGWGSKP